MCRIVAIIFSFLIKIFNYFLFQNAGDHCKFGLWNRQAQAGPNLAPCSGHWLFVFYDCQHRGCPESNLA